MGKKLDATKSQAQVYGEAVVCVLFVIVSAIGALYLLDLVKLTDVSRLWTGRVLAAFSLLALFYLSFKANQRKG